MCGRGGGTAETKLGNEVPARISPDEDPRDLRCPNVRAGVFLNMPEKPVEGMSLRSKYRPPERSKAIALLAFSSCACFVCLRNLLGPPHPSNLGPVFVALLNGCGAFFLVWLTRGRKDSRKRLVMVVGVCYAAYQVARLIFPALVAPAANILSATFAIAFFAAASASVSLLWSAGSADVG